MPRYGLFFTAGLTASLLLSGCTVLVGHDYVSPNWQDPGIYQAVLEERTTGGFKVTYAEPGEEAAFISLDNATWGLSFLDEGLNQSWQPGSYELRFVRHDAEGDGRLVLQFDSESVMAWSEGGIEAGEVRQSAAAFIENTTDLAQEEQQALLENLMESRKPSPQAPTGEGRHHVVSYRGDHRLERHFQSLGGVSAFTAENAARPDGMLPHFAQVELLADGWSYYFEVATLRLDRQEGDRVERLWVTPDDTVAYVTRTQREESQDEVRGYLERALADLGRDVPQTEGWTFDHEEVRDDLWGD